MISANGLTPLQDFADLHKIPRSDAIRMWKLGFISGSDRGTRQQPYIVIGANGQRDFWIQFHNTPGCQECDQCPHSI